MDKTPFRRLLESKLRGRDLDKYVRIRRAEGLGWRQIANELKRDTGEPVSHESLRSWFPSDANTADANTAA